LGGALEILGWHLKKGPLNHWFAQGFGKVQNDDFPGISNFLHENHKFQRKRKIFCAVFATFSLFLVPRGPDAPGLIKPMEFHPFL
jgi:hypothetical protein